MEFDQSTIHKFMLRNFTRTFES